MGFYKSQVIFPQIIKASGGRKLSPCFCTNSSELTGVNTMQYPSPSSRALSTHCEGCLPRSVPQRWKACVCCLTLGILVLANPCRDRAYGLTPLQPHASLLSWQDLKKLPQAWASWEGHRKSFSVCWIHVLKLWKTTVGPPFSIFTPEWITFKPRSSSTWDGLGSDRWRWLVTEDCPGKTFCFSREFCHWWTEGPRLCRLCLGDN